MNHAPRSIKTDRIKFMKLSTPWSRFASLLVIPLLAGAWGILPAPLRAAEQNQAQQKSSDAEQSFASPDEAIKALQAAVAAKDQASLRELFGPDFHELMTGDKVQDANNAKRFAAAMGQSCQPVKDGDDKITLEVGPNNWPMPIPLVKADGQWHFDTAAGKEEIINRHIGKDELHAIGVCRAYVIAQRRHEFGLRRRSKICATSQEHARKEGRPLLAGGDKRAAQSLRVLGGGSAGRGLCRP
jgi:hypothetical protein